MEGHEAAPEVLPRLCIAFECRYDFNNVRLLPRFDKRHALSLIIKRMGEVELPPTFVLTLFNIPHRPTLTLIPADIHRRRIAQRNYKRLIRERRHATEVLWPVHSPTLFKRLTHRIRLLATTAILNGYRALRNDVEERTGVIVPGAHLTRRKTYCSDRHCGWSIESFGVRNVSHAEDVSYCRVSGDATENNGQKANQDYVFSCQVYLS